MQSLNEELVTINLQYQSKAEELTQLNNDMKNLLDATEIGTIFLDNQLEILRFTPQVKKLFNVIATDVGRPISHVVSKFEYTGLEDDIREVIERLTVKEREVKTTTGDWYGVRIMPYRTLDNFISGAVLTFNTITPYKELEHGLLRQNRYAALLLESVGCAAVLLNGSLELVLCNGAFAAAFGWGQEAGDGGAPFTALVHRYWGTRSLDKPVASSLSGEGRRELRVKNKSGQSGVYEVAWRPLADPASGKAELVLITLQPQQTGA